MAIVHYNTPELTEALVASIRKHGGQDYEIVIMDNSDQRPLTKKTNGVRILDNTKGQLINFDEELAKFPNKQEHVRKSSNFASTKHAMSVQYLMENLGTDFLLMDSDILITQSVDHLFEPEFAAVGAKQYKQFGYQYDRVRLLPMLCYLNAPRLVKHGAKYFDPKRTFGLLLRKNDPNNWYDTGAVILEDIHKIKPFLVAKIYKKLTDHYVHYQHGSWNGRAVQEQLDWLEQHRELWSDEPKTEKATTAKTDKTESAKTGKAAGKVAVCVIGRMENRYAVEFVEHYKKLGVDKIIIYDNNRKDEQHFEDVLQKYIDKGLVDIIDFRDKTGAQNLAYNNCYAQYGKDYDWIGFFDFDEFLALPKGTKIGKWLQQFDKASVVLVNWQIMTDGGLVTDDGRNCATRFKKPISDSLKRTDGQVFNRHVKSIVRGGLSGVEFRLNPHTPSKPALTCVNVKNEQVAQSAFANITDSPVRLHHYMTKTIEEYAQHKCVRLFPLGRGFDDTWLKTAWENFWNVNGHTPEKDEWYQNWKNQKS